MIRSFLYAPKRKIFTALVLGGLVVVGIGYSFGHSKTAKATQSNVRLAYTMVTRSVFTASGNDVGVLVYVQKRYQKSNGDWKQVTTFYGPNGERTRTNTGYGIGGRGVFSLNRSGRTLDFISPRSSQNGASPELTTSESASVLATDPRVVRRESVSGYDAYVLRINDADPSYYRELYFAPGFDSRVPIKMVHVAEAGTTVTEASKISLGEPPDQVFGSLPDWPIAYGAFQHKIQAAEADGDSELARTLRAELQSQLQGGSK